LDNNECTLRSLTGVNTWSGSINMTPFDQFEVDADQLLISGVLRDENSRVTGSLQKTGMGTLVLSNGPNKYFDVTEVIDGVLEVRSNGALGSSLYITVDDGGTLELAPLPGFGLSFKQSLSLSGSGFENEGALRSVNVLNSWTGPIQLMDVVSI